jgi:hypothetical protein
VLVTYSTSPRALRTTTYTYKALPSVLPYKRVRLNSGKLLKSKYNFVLVPLVPLLTLVTISVYTLTYTPSRTYTPAHTLRKSLIRVSATTYQAPADYLQGDTRDVSYLGYIKSILAS